MSKGIYYGRQCCVMFDDREHKKNKNKIKERKFRDLCIKLTWDTFRLTYFECFYVPCSHPEVNYIPVADKISI